MTKIRYSRVVDALLIELFQYHSEASPGPLDSVYLFEQFLGMVSGTDAAVYGVS